MAAIPNADVPNPLYVYGADADSTDEPADRSRGRRYWERAAERAVEKIGDAGKLYMADAIHRV